MALIHVIQKYIYKQREREEWVSKLKYAFQLASREREREKEKERERDIQMDAQMKMSSPTDASQLPLSARESIRMYINLAQEAAMHRLGDDDDQCDQ